MLGGRAAEELICGETTTGPESDLEQATSLARQMVGRWGMSEEIGPVSALPRSGEESYGAGGASQRTLAEHRDQLDHLAQVLLERETLDEADAYAVAGIPRPGASAQPVVAQA